MLEMGITFSFTQLVLDHCYIDNVVADCSDLQYISSAEIRVLLIMYKACRGGLTLKGVNETVSEILKQAGFDMVIWEG